RAGGRQQRDGAVVPSLEEDPDGFLQDSRASALLFGQLPQNRPERLLLRFSSRPARDFPGQYLRAGARSQPERRQEGADTAEGVAPAGRGSRLPGFDRVV